LVPTQPAQAEEVVNGLVTVIVPVALSTIRVGPLYRQPVLPAVRSVSALMAVLVVGRARWGTASGSSVWNTGRSLQPFRPYQRQVKDGDAVQLIVPVYSVVALPLNRRLPLTLMVSLVCRGPLMVSPVTKLMRTQ
jgi:hypothetical protein